MYWEWTTLIGTDKGEGGDRFSVLERLPPESAKDVVLPVVKSVVVTLGISQPPLPSSFTIDKEVEWCLQVVCYGLSLPLTEHEIIKDCVSIYCEWLSCLSSVPKISVPKPIVDRPNFYARKIINQLISLFTPRKGEVLPFLYRTDIVQDTINRQAVLCHRVLRTLQNIIRASNILDTETWECILLFLISINDSLLSPPSIKEDIGDQLCERVLSVLFEIWLLACSKSFPSPPLWKTLRESCKSWRHRANLFDQWNRINLVLTSRVLAIMYGPNYIKLEDEGNLSPEEMSNDCIVQTWFRLLHCLGNPCELTQPTIISQTQNFLQYAIASEAVVDPCQHPCLSVLPSIFHQAMKGIAALVDAFLGLPIRESEKFDSFIPSESPPPLPSPIPPARRLAKSFSVAPTGSIYKGHRTSILGLPNKSKDTSSIPSSSHSSLQSSTLFTFPSTESDSQILLAATRPRVNSILHVFGPWLFEASLICCDEPKFEGEGRRTSRGSAVPASLPESIDIPFTITIDKYYLGRAEALGTLCRIFCSKKTGEEILPAYLARFYIAVQKGLKDLRNEVLSSILTNSANLLRVDLDGVSILVPVIVASLEAVLPSKDSIRNDLRRSAIQLLLSLLSLPLHFLNVPIKDVLDRTGQVTTFIQLKPRLANLLINALQVETDSTNIQMILGGIIMFVSDAASFEEVDKSNPNLDIDSPTNLLNSENTSIRSFSEYSNSFDEHTLGYSDMGENYLDSAHALFVRATYLVCHRLISTWKDLPVSLAALELLNGLARTKVHDQDPLECRRAVKWICDFIIHQCSRPPPAHSKDLHSSIVAAFQSVTTWLVSHPYLLEDKESLGTVLEVVEIGISGTKSTGKPGETLKLKDEKELKPVSLRVRDAAESLLCVIFEQVGVQSPRNATRTLSLVDEFLLLDELCSQKGLCKEDVVSHFRYFVVDHTTLMALLEEPLGNEQDPQPTATMVLRSPTGRHAWTLQMRHLPKHRSKSFSSNGISNPGRPLPMNDVGTRYDIQARHFPEAADRIVPCKADKAIPGLETSIATSDEESVELSRLSIILENQIHLEKRVENMIRDEPDESYPNLRTECQPPPVSQDFQTARLLLSHLGFISVQARSDFSLPKLAPIDSRHPDFIAELEALDATSFRTNDTVHIFYVRAGQKRPDEILGNVESKSNVHPHFLEFLHSLGWPVNIGRHSGWTGNLKTSWRRFNPLSTSQEKDRPGRQGQEREGQSEMHGGSLYNGESSVLYWSDVISEIAFVVPTQSRKASSDLNESTTVWNVAGESSGGNPPGGKSSDPGSVERSGSDEKSARTATSSSSSLEFEKHLGNSDEASRARKALAGKLCDTKIFVVWLESFEDSFHFPAGDLLSSTWTGSEGTRPVEPSLIIFIHALRNGLFRIHMEGQSLRTGFATPLIDGMVVSRRILGNLVRFTALNMARRKRLENENFQPPHVRRKLKIQEIVHKFPSVMSESEPEFYSQFYNSVGRGNGSVVDR